MQHALIFDCEFLTAEGAPARFWCGPDDPDPIVVQIGVVKIGLEGEFPLLETLRLHVAPLNRDGQQIPIDPFVTRLTGLTQRTIEKEGIPLKSALEKVQDFAAGRRLWSWGKDELNLVAISCYVAGIPPVLPVGQFGNACALLRKAGMPYDDIKKTPSSGLAAYFQIAHPPLRKHDALDDARSVAFAIQALLRQEELSPSDLA